MRSLAVAITDTAIKNHAADLEVGELRDQRHPLLLRFQKSRNKATWYVVRYEQGKKTRYRLGYWPTLKTRDAQELVVDAIKKLVKGEFVAADKFDNVCQLLTWYRDRCMAESFKANNRKKAIISHIDHHLIPKLGDIRLCEINKQCIDERFFLPLQANGLKVSTIKHMFYTLKPAFKRALNLGYISSNPMSDVVFGQHVTKRIKPKECALLITDKALLVEGILSQPILNRTFMMIMLMFGTRIGETRNLKWSHVHLDECRIVIPAELTKTEDSHVLPITGAAMSLLQEYRNATASRKPVYLFEYDNKQITEAQAQYLVRSASAGKWSAHDLRKLARSAWAELGIDYWVGERLLNHKPKGLDAVYIKAGAYDVKLAALNKYHEWLFSSVHDAGIGENK